MEADRNLLATSIQAGFNYFTSEEIKVFRDDYRVTMKKVKKLAHRNMQRFIASSARSQFLCWDVIKKMRSCSSSVDISVNTLVDHFSHVYFTPTEPLIFQNPLQSFDLNEVNDLQFTDEELVNALKNLNGKAAVGPERVPSRIIKLVFSSMKSRAPLLALMNLCFTTGRLPKDWGSSEIFVLYKMKGDRMDPNSYRGINLINDFCRLFERLIESRLSTWMSVRLPQGPMQFGFRRGVGTQDAFFLLSSTLRYFSRVKGVMSYACFVDLRKAFPSVFRSKVIESLNKAGAPKNLVRAISSLFSLNECSLRMNSFLSRAFSVNRGVKEGGINSPSVFVIAYAEALENSGVSELPVNLLEIDTNKVYYFVFADDLVLVSGNLSRMGEVLRCLESRLLEFGMSINREKTEWMPVVPLNREICVDSDHDLSLRLESGYLNCVDSFTYLGFRMDLFLSPNDHVKAKRTSLFSAARSAGKIFRQLEVSNLRSLRTYFLSFVSSQLYGLCFFNFQRKDVNKAAKIFVQEVFNLPDSFPIQVACSLLNLRHFELSVIDARLNFIQRSQLTQDSLTYKTICFDESVLSHHGSGFSHDLMTVMAPFFDFEDTPFPSLSDLSTLQDLRDQMAIQLNEQRSVSFHQSSGLSFLSSIIPNGVFPLGFQEYLGELDYESVRVLLIFLGDLVRFSFSRVSTVCPFCPIELHSYHLFSCPNAPFRNQLPNWNDSVCFFINESWSVFVRSVFTCLSLWMSSTNFFNQRSCGNVEAFFNI